MIVELSDFDNKTIFLEEEDNREISIYKFKNVSICSDSIFYPNILFYSLDDKSVCRPINETTMSLSKIKKDEKVIINTEPSETYIDDLFFFIYNTDNYYHFIYDSLPYLITYLSLKKQNKSLKLLMSYPNSQKNSFYPFVMEFLELLDITKDDIILVNNNTIYGNIYVSSSYTHGGLSNQSPRKEVYDFFQNISEKIDKIVPDEKKLKKIYISRRTWLHNNFSNIGTNYTTRRKLKNEDELVDYLVSKGFVEIFTENLTTLEKISLFRNSEIIIGSIGGGLCNVLFSKKTTKLIPIISPTFLEINDRFKYSFSLVETQYFDKTSHVESGKFKKYMRIKYNNIIGEISEVYKNKIKIEYTDENLAGWNSQMNFKNLIVNKNDVEILDNGLNSCWKINMREFKKLKI